MEKLIESHITYSAETNEQVSLLKKIIFGSSKAQYEINMDIEKRLRSKENNRKPVEENLDTVKNYLVQNYMDSKVEELFN